MSYFCGLFHDSFQTTKGHSYNGYSIYMPSFNQFLPVVPSRCDKPSTFFMWKIDHNFVNCQPKLVGRNTLMNPLCVPCFILFRVCICILWLKMPSLWKEEEKNKETFAWDWLTWFAPNLVCGFTYIRGISAANFIHFTSSHQCGVMASWTAQHTTVCLDTVNKALQCNHII